MCDPASDDVSHQLVCYECGRSESAHALEIHPNPAVTNGKVEICKGSKKEVNIHYKGSIFIKVFLILVI
jgi:hypothetical protein